MNEEKQIIEKIIQIRKNQRFTKRQIAEALCMSEANYGRLENGKSILQYRHLADIARFFGMSIFDVITYPEKYINHHSASDPVEAILQIRLQKDKKDQVLRLVFGDNNIEILNK